MSSVELDHLSTMLSKARGPEEVFGTLTGTRAEMLDAARKVFRQMAKVAHPDVYQGTTDFERAGTIFKQLTALWEQAQLRIEQGIYGRAEIKETFVPFIIHTGTRHYSIEHLLTRGDLCMLYTGSFTLAGRQTRGLLKIPMKPGDNDLMANEARILHHLQASEGYEKLRHFVPQLVDSFSYLEQESGVVRNMNIFTHIDGFYSLKEVREAYPEGIDPKDMAWIWRRVLIALNFAHSNHVIHGAVLPTHIMIHPEQHGLVLIDWSYAVLRPDETGERISAISSAYRDWYPAEVFAHEEPTPGLDIAMAAKCMIDLLGGDPHKRMLPTALPWQLQSYFKGCTLPNPRQRPQDAYTLLQDFDTLIERLWGPKKFHVFTMPKR
jgi:hypothetical protein